MNNFDKENLDFIMALSTDEEWEEWAQYCEEDDFVYALELLQKRRKEVESAMQALDDEEDALNVIDLTEANKVINKIKGMK